MSNYARTSRIINCTEPVSIREIALFSYVLCVFLVLIPTKSNAADYTCIIQHIGRLNCSVWRDGNKVSLGGFQAAPVFTMIAYGQAVDHRGERYNVIYKNGNSTFLPIKGNSYSTITIFGVDLR